MKISEIGIPKGANKRKKRRGRGAGSGHGKTSGKGHKGSKSRTGHHGGPRIGFEGGQMPLIRRIPKRGFINEFKKEFTIVNLGCLNKFSKDAVISPQELFDANLIKDKSAVVKVLGDGEMTKSLTVKAHRFSKSAVRKIEKAGGSIVILSGAKNPKIDSPAPRPQNDTVTA